MDKKVNKGKLVIGSDHAGYELKEHLKSVLAEEGYILSDKGTSSADSTDYPDYAHAVAKEVVSEKQLGILICGSANGVNMAANKHAGIRAAIAWNAEVASLARAHNDANILSLPARYVTSAEAEGIVNAFLTAGFEGGRHARRVAKINEEKIETC